MQNTRPKAQPTASTRARVERASENLIDLDLVVDDCRRSLDAAVADLQRAVQARDRGAADLAHLIAQHAAANE